MTNDEGRKPEGAPERSPKAGEGAPSGVDGNSPKRFSVQRKMAIVARLLRGEPLDLVARQTNVARLGSADQDLCYVTVTIRSVYSLRGGKMFNSEPRPSSIRSS